MTTEERIEAHAFAMWRTRNPDGFIDTIAGKADYQRQKAVLVPFAKATVEYEEERANGTD